MGVSLCNFSDSNSGGYVPGEPVPFHFHILRITELKTPFSDRGLFIIRIRYPHCTTFDGEKILVYDLPKEKMHEKVYVSRNIDPHFLEKVDDPIARFPANDSGFKNAVLFCKALLRSWI